MCACVCGYMHVTVCVHLDVCVCEFVCARAYMFVFARVHNGVRVSNQRRESALFRWLSSPATVDKEKKGGGDRKSGV